MELLENFKNFQYEIELKDGAKPYHAKPYNISQALTALLKEELDRLCQEKVMRK